MSDGESRTRPLVTEAAKATRSIDAGDCYSRPRKRLDLNGSTKLAGLLRAGDPRGEVAYAWHAKEAVRFFYDIGDPVLAERYLRELADDLQDSEFPPEVNSLGRSLQRWMRQICNWTLARASNGAAEAINNLVKRVKRVAFGFRQFQNYRIRLSGSR